MHPQRIIKKINHKKISIVRCVLHFYNEKYTFLIFLVLVGIELYFTIKTGIKFNTTTNSPFSYLQDILKQFRFCDNKHSNGKNTCHYILLEVHKNEQDGSKCKP